MEPQGSRNSEEYRLNMSEIEDVRSKTVVGNGIKYRIHGLAIYSFGLSGKIMGVRKLSDKCADTVYLSKGRTFQGESSFPE